MKSNTIMRICSLIMAMVIVVGLLPVSAFAANNTVVVLSASDYQQKGSSPQSNTSTILSRIKADYASADGFLFGGDYSQNSLGNVDDTTSGKNELDGIVDAMFPGMDSQIYIQGNHDADSCTTNGTLSTSGAHDTANYGVYVINEKDYPWGYTDALNDTAFKQTVSATAAALDDYLDAKAVEGYKKPIFVVSHLPLHYTSRTDEQGDGKYAKYLYDVLDEAGKKGLNIIFLFGHNHSNTYDDYLGGGQIYLPKGSNICIANAGSTSPYFTDTLNFTYMNCGYVGYIGGQAGTNLSISVFEITNNKVIVKRYGINGIVDLKAAGKTTSGAPAADTSTIASGAEISATGEHNYTSVTVDATCTEAGSVTYTCVTCGDSYEEPIAALGHNYTTSNSATCTEDGFIIHTCTTCGDTYNGDPVTAFGHQYSSTVTAPTCATAGYTTHVCSNCGHTYTDNEVDALGHNYTSVVTAPTCTTAGSTTYTCTVCADTYAVVGTVAGHTYESSIVPPTCTTIGYTVHTCTACGVYYNDSYVSAIGHSNIETVIAPTCTTAGCTTYTCTTCGHSTASNTVAALGHKYSSQESGNSMIYTCSNCGHSYSEEIIDKHTYSKVTKFTANKNHLIVLYSNKKYYALSHKDNEFSVVQVTVVGNRVTSRVTQDLLWQYNTSKKLFYTDGNTTQYLNSIASTTLGGNPTLDIDATKSANITYSANKLKVGTRYLSFTNSNLALRTSGTTIYLFQQK